MVLALAAGSWAATEVRRADEARIAYGTLRDVPVVTRDLAPGAVVAPEDVEMRALPAAAVPDSVAAETVGRAVRQPLHAGEVVVEARLGGRGSGPSALLASGRRALAIPQQHPRLALGVGDVVDVMAPAESIDGSPADGARRVARSAEVLAVDEATVTVAVSAAETPAVARAVLDGSVALALVGPAP